MRLKDQVAVVTGAGSGMGKEIARLFAQEGAHVIAGDLKPDGVNELISELDGSVSGSVQFQQVDISNREQAEALIDVAVEKYGRLDILINNAGIMDNMMPVGELDDELWERVLAVNLTGMMYTCRKAVGIMEKQEGCAKIVNTASVGGLQGSRAGAAYTASKFGVVGLTRNIGFQYATKGIRCNAVAPGGVKTNIGLGLRSIASEFGLERATAGIGAHIREGDACEIAHVVLFLASDESSFVNGTVITADGGWTAF
ncbi:SDR family oxidoreductase [Eubacteriales bacterium OttesenSCG-928-N14]|nr:SDR family oxidoreductase [Eubacteriales bacterium OttesenSCG-928-N14]